MTVSKPVDPLAGIPLVNAPVAPKAPKAVVTNPMSTAPISLAAHKASRKRAKLTGQQYKDARDSARVATGYGPTSPIWGTKLIDVLVTIETLLNAGDVAAALTLNQELQKRLATNALISAQRS